MSEANVEIVRSIYAAVARRDGKSPYECYAEDIEWDVSDVGGVVLGSVYRGHAGVRRFWREWLMGFAEIDLEVEELVDAEPHVLATIHERGRGRSGVVIERRHYAVWTIREGKVSRMLACTDPSKAREAIAARYRV